MIGFITLQQSAPSQVTWQDSTVYAFYAFYAWWLHFPQLGALAEGTSSRSRSRGIYFSNASWKKMNNHSNALVTSAQRKSAEANTLCVMRHIAGPIFQTHLQTLRRACCSVSLGVTRTRPCRQTWLILLRFSSRVTISYAFYALGVLFSVMHTTCCVHWYYRVILVNIYLKSKRAVYIQIIYIDIYAYRYT